MSAGMMCCGLGVDATSRMALFVVASGFPGWFSFAFCRSASFTVSLPWLGAGLSRPAPSLLPELASSRDSGFLLAREPHGGRPEGGRHRAAVGRRRTLGAARRPGPRGLCGTGAQLPLTSRAPVARTSPQAEHS